MNRLPYELVCLVLTYEPIAGRWTAGMMRAASRSWHHIFTWATFNTGAGTAAVWRAIESGWVGPMPDWVRAQLAEPEAEWLPSMLSSSPRYGDIPCRTILQLDFPHLLANCLNDDEVVDAAKPLVCFLLSPLQIDVGAVNSLRWLVGNECMDQSAAQAWALYYASRSQNARCEEILRRELPMHVVRLVDEMLCACVVPIDDTVLRVLLCAMAEFDDPYIAQMLRLTTPTPQLTEMIVRGHKVKCATFFAPLLGADSLAVIPLEDVRRVIKYIPKNRHCIFAAMRNRVCSPLTSLRTPRCRATC